jgi:hypothetical protein
LGAVMSVRMEHVSGEAASDGLEINLSSYILWHYLSNLLL